MSWHYHSHLHCSPTLQASNRFHIVDRVGMRHLSWHLREWCIVSDLVRQLDFHALSLLCSSQPRLTTCWDHDRLAKEWNLRCVQVLRAYYNESLAATVELSLASPTCRKLGPNAHDIVGVIASSHKVSTRITSTGLFPPSQTERLSLTNSAASL